MPRVKLAALMLLAVIPIGARSDMVGCESCIAPADSGTDFVSESLHVTTLHDAETHLFTTKGSLKSKLETAKLAQIVRSVSSYNDWALQDINKDYKERGLLVLMKGLRAENEGKILYADYDLNLPWPFNFENMSLRLDEVKVVSRSDGVLQRLEYAMAGHSLTMNRFALSLEVTDDSGFGTLNFEFQVEIARLLSPFLSRDRYVKNVQGRIVQMMKNLDAYCLTRSRL